MKFTALFTQLPKTLFKDIPESMEKAYNDSLKKTGKQVIRKIKKNTPRGKFSRSPGSLKRSVQGSFNESGAKFSSTFIITAYADNKGYRYGGSVEFGRKAITAKGKLLKFRHSKTGNWVVTDFVKASPARPFFYIETKFANTQMESNYKEALDKEIDKITKRFK